MARIERFEEIEAWKAARGLTNAIYSMSNQGPIAKDFGLRDQLRRASVSIMANVAEGFERGGNSEFLHFLALAKASSALAGKRPPMETRRPQPSSAAHNLFLRVLALNLELGTWHSTLNLEL
jgi:hypothetical protein